MTFEWLNKVVVITGAASGIGAQVVRFLIEEQVKHVAILDIAEEAGRALQDELNSNYGARVTLILCDVTDDAQLTSAYAEVVRDQGGVDVVVNNAGMCNDSVQMFRKEIQLNVTAVISNTIKALNLMRKDQGGRGGAIINISSCASFYKIPEMAIYCGTKAAVTHFTNCLGGDKEFYSKTGVRIFTMCFGSTATSLFTAENMGHFDRGLEDKLKDIVDQFPPQRVESAAQAVIEAYKQADTGSVWLAVLDQPVKDITDTMNQSYGLFLPYITDK